MSERTKQPNRPKVSIGMPVYNEEKFLRKRLDSLVSQTFTDFELIISDNASTDSTSTICDEYSKKDKRIHVIHQKKNIGVLLNFDFVLQEAVGDYFVWAAIDDVWTTDFLEKHVNVLELNKNVVGSISEIKFFDTLTQDLKSNKVTIKNKTEYKEHYTTHLMTGSYEEKVKFYLGFLQANSVYAVFRTDKLQKSSFTNQELAWDLTLILNVLKYGDIHVIDEVLMYKYRGDRPQTSYFESVRQRGVNIPKSIFPFIPLTLWCVKHLGIKIFMKNLPFFIRINRWGEKRILSDLIQLCKRKISR